MSAEYDNRAEFARKIGGGAGGPGLLVCLR
jgi:hypothetical protein